MRSLFYYFGNLEAKDTVEVIRSLPPFVTPIITFLRDNKEINLSLLLEAPKEKTRIKWRKFRDPTYNKYVNAALFKYGYLGTRGSRDVDFRVVETEEPEGWIDYNTYTITLPSSLTDTEKLLVIKLAKGELNISPFDPVTKEQILIL